MPSTATIPVMEIFGPTVQGEGMVIGQKTMFVRTAGCDYRCAWCDSAFTWDGTAKDRIHQMTAEDIWSQLQQLAGGRFAHVTISGGNPLLLRSLEPLVDLLHEQRIAVAVETQGSRWQPWLLKVDDVTLSPKPPSSGMQTDWDKLDDIVHQLAARGASSRYSIKIVIFDDNDLAYATAVHQRYPEAPFYLQVGNNDTRRMDTSEHALTLLRQYEDLIDKVMQSPLLNRVSVLPQLHTLVWGNKQGV